MLQPSCRLRVSGLGDAGALAAKDPAEPAHVALLVVAVIASTAPRKRNESCFIIAQATCHVDGFGRPPTTKTAAADEDGSR